jgi:cytoskeletal protein CcmA (bactofilin family)
MFRSFKSKTKKSLFLGSTDAMTKDSDRAQEQVYRRLKDRVDPNESVIAARSSFVGGISGQAGAHILGSFEGDIQSEALVRVGKSARIKGNIRSPYIILEGELEGDIRCARQVELRTEAKMRGNIETERLAIADGCFFEGQIRMANPEDQPVRFTERRPAEED